MVALLEFWFTQICEFTYQKYRRGMIMESLIIINTVASVLINKNQNIYTSAILPKAVARLLPLILILEVFLTC